jgi:Replication protein C N-terminal domain
MEVEMNNITPIFGHTGHTKVTLETIQADEFAAKFVMSKGIHHKALLEKTIKAAPALGYGKAAMALLTVIHGYVRDIDWQDGRPICFASNETLAWDSQLSVSAIKKSLRELAQLGLISRTGDGNGKRTGGRHGPGPKKGHLREDTTGINLAPLASKYNDHCEAAANYDRAQAQMKTMTIAVRRFLRNIGQIREQCIGVHVNKTKWEPLSKASDELAPRIVSARHNRNLSAMSELLTRLAELHQAISNVLKTKLALITSKKETPQGGNFAPQILSTTTLNSYGIISANETSSRGDVSTPVANDEHKQTYTEHGPIYASELGYLFPTTAEYFPEISSLTTWEAIARRISYGGPSMIGLKRELWERAIQELPLGHPQIMFSITLDWVSAEPGREKRAGGYFIAMWKRYNAGQLNLFPTVMGRRKRMAA